MVIFSPIKASLLESVSLCVLTQLCAVVCMLFLSVTKRTKGLRPLSEQSVLWSIGVRQTGVLQTEVIAKPSFLDYHVYFFYQVSSYQTPNGQGGQISSHLSHQGNRGLSLSPKTSGRTRWCHLSTIAGTTPLLVQHRRECQRFRNYTGKSWRAHTAHYGPLFRSLRSLNVLGPL